MWPRALSLFTVCFVVRIVGRLISYISITDRRYKSSDRQIANVIPLPQALIER